MAQILLVDAANLAVLESEPQTHADLSGNMILEDHAAKSIKLEPHALPCEAAL